MPTPKSKRDRDHVPQTAQNIPANNSSMMTDCLSKKRTKETFFLLGSNCIKPIQCFLSMECAVYFLQTLFFLAAADLLRYLLSARNAEFLALSDTD